MMPPSYQILSGKITKIINEMKKNGIWQKEPLPPKAYNFQQAFGQDTMVFSQWLQFIFIPRVQELIKYKGELPSKSSIGTQATREFDGAQEATKLTQLLCEFDILFA